MAHCDEVSIKMTKAFAYLRVSGKSQLDGDGFPRQREAILAYAAKHNIEIADSDWFEERAICGATEWEDRPAWTSMIDRLNGTRTIIVEKLDRLARELFIQEYILRDLRKRDVTLLTAAEEDTTEADPTRVLFRQILGAIAQYDRTMIVRKLRGARQRMLRDTGRCEGQKPYGTLSGEKETLVYMATLRREGLSYDAIAVTLTAAGFPTRHGKKWYGTTVKKILRAQAA